jgi:nucleoside-diphosphate-sugar epimerase
VKILLTGGAGYLGSTITNKLLNEGYSVTVLDSLEFNQLSLLPFVKNKNFKFIYGDARNKDLLKKLVTSHDIIIPLAARVGFPACDADPITATQLNYEQIVDVANFADGKAKILFPNTNSGYGVAEGGQVCSETSPLNPISHYGVTKVNAERFLLQNTDAICFRLATVFGPSPRMRTDLLVNEFVYKAITDKYIVLFEPHFKRNYIHIEDVAEVFSFMITNYDTYKNEVFNVGLSDANLSKLELVNLIKKYVPDFSISVSDYYEDPDKRDYIVSNQKIEATGWKPQYSIDDGIQQLIDTYKMIVPRMSSEFRNGFPLGYANTL